MPNHSALNVPKDAVGVRHMRPMTPQRALEIASATTHMNQHHTYDIIRAADYLSTLGLKLQQELRLRYERGSL